MFLTYLMLAVALSLSAIAAFYSIVGLAAIFSAAVLPIVLMGSILEVAKLTVTVWLHEYWSQCQRAMKAYLVPAVGVLMLITSMGIFGFLSKAHLDQAVPAGDISAQVSIYDEKIKTQRDNIETARAALKQLDAAVDQTMARSNDEKGAERAVQIRRTQQAERTRLQQDIQRAQSEIVKLNEQRAPVAAQARKVEAEVGPIKYIAALIYGDNPDGTLLEKAVRWVIIILVLVFDPLAVMMLLAATESYRWEKNRVTDDTDSVAVTTTPTNAERLASWRERWTRWRKRDDTDVDDGGTAATSMADQPAGPAVAVEPVVEVVGRTQDTQVGYPIQKDADVADEPVGDEKPQPVDYAAARKTVRTNPTKESEWEGEELDAESRLYYGPVWPRYPRKGDLFVKINTLPTTLYKFNGEKWIDSDKNLTDRYAFDTQYIDYLIRKIGTGEYDPELLTDAERGQIELRLKQDLT